MSQKTRYTDAELQEFRSLIEEKIEVPMSSRRVENYNVFRVNQTWHSLKICLKKHLAPAC